MRWKLIYVQIYTKATSFCILLLYPYLVKTSYLLEGTIVFRSVGLSIFVQTGKMALLQ